MMSGMCLKVKGKTPLDIFPILLPVGPADYYCRDATKQNPKRQQANSIRDFRTKKGRA
jgi:hypothetical protein